MRCAECLHWAEPRSVDSLPDYPIGFCELFQKDVAGEYAGCAGRFYLERDRMRWKGKLVESFAPADKTLEVPAGVKIVSISAPDPATNQVKVLCLVPKDK